MVFRKSCDFWFALISVGPDAAEFFLVNSAVFCRPQLALNLSQQFSHPAPSQISSKGNVIIPKSGGNRSY
jgi:hypothetical protein